MVKTIMTERSFNLVLPLACQATAMHTKDTADKHHQAASCAVSLLSIRQADVDSKNQRSTRLIQIMPGIRTSTMAIRTIGTRTINYKHALSADQIERSHANFLNDKPSFEELVKAYFDCRKNKRNKASALAFEENLESNLTSLYAELIDGTYAPGKSICFVITRPKPREVWAADFRERIVHHLFYNRISPRFYAGFIADSCACIPVRGTLYAAKRLESKIRSATENWSKPCFYLKCDLANFFVAIDKEILHKQLASKIMETWWLWLAELILFHDPRLDYVFKGEPSSIGFVPAHKRLVNQPSHLGLPIGNLSSQFFANVYLDALDQFIKHRIKAKYYIRYVDDFIILHESSVWLNDALAEITRFLTCRLNANLNPKKTILQPVDRGVDFVGHVVKPWCRSPRKRTVKEAISQVKNTSENKVFEVANSYYGLLRQSKSHHDRAMLSNALRKRGYTINHALTKTFRKTEHDRTRISV
jgi:RNA-directed DNA polymerase